MVGNVSVWREFEMRSNEFMLRPIAGNKTRLKGKKANVVRTDVQMLY